MASKAVVDAVMARLAANWTNCPVVEMNTVRTAPAAGTPFLVVQFPVSNEEHITLGQVGQRTFREEGGFRLVLAMPSGAGLGTGQLWSDQLRALFRAAQFAGVNCLGATGGPLADGNDDANYFKFSVVVEYYADIFA